MITVTADVWFWVLTVIVPTVVILIAQALMLLSLAVIHHDLHDVLSMLEEEEHGDD